MNIHRDNNGLEIIQFICFLSVAGSLVGSLVYRPLPMKLYMSNIDSISMMINRSQCRSLCATQRF